MTTRLGYRVTEEGRGIVVWNGMTETGYAVRFVTCQDTGHVFAFGRLEGRALVHVERHPANPEDTFTGEVEVLHLPSEATP
jgi:hypothetical protein